MTLEVSATALASDLTGRLTAWIKAENITGHYAADGIAARIVKAIHPSYITRWLDSGDTAYLRDRCERIRDHADLTDAQRAAESRRHGNDPRPATRGVVND